MHIRVPGYMWDMYFTLSIILTCHSLVGYTFIKWEWEWNDIKKFLPRLFEWSFRRWKGGFDDIEARGVYGEFLVSE